MAYCKRCETIFVRDGTRSQRLCADCCYHSKQNGTKRRLRHLAGKV